MIDNNSLLKLFVRVPNGVTFNGTEVSTAVGNTKKIYFDENDHILWVNGVSFGLTAAQGTALSTLIGSDTGKSARTIAQEVVNSIMDWQDADSDTIINTLKEVLDWFKNLPEGEAGALSLINSVGKPKVTYTAETAAAYNAQLEGALNSTDQLTAEQATAYNTTVTGAEKTEGDTLSAEEANMYNATLSGAVAEGDTQTAATGLYSMVETAVAGGIASAGKKTGELLVDASVNGTKVEVESTPKLQNAVSAAETSLQTVSIAGVNATITGESNAKAAEITKLNLQGALFSNQYESTPLSYTYLGVTVSIKESNGELSYLNVDPSVLENRVTTLEEFDPWESYSAPTPDPEPSEP